MPLCTITPVKTPMCIAGIHHLSQLASERFENVRKLTAEFIQAPEQESVIFTKGTTEGVNLVMQSWVRQHVKQGQNLILSQPEHHSNLVPWQMLAEEKGLELRLIPLDDRGALDMTKGLSLFDENTAFVAVQQMSNVLGIINDLHPLIQRAHELGAKVLVDGAQSVPHMPVNVQEMDCDFLVFSAHKMLGPTGVGVLYGKLELLESMPPYQGGGAMIEEVWEDHFTWGKLPFRFEAGTPNIAGVLGLGAAIEYLNELGLENVLEHEQLLTTYALEKFKQIEDIILYGPETASGRGGIISFNLKGIHPRDLGEILDQQGVAIRTGHHCCQPLMRHYGVQGMARASFYVYNTHEEVDALCAAIKRAQRIFQRAARVKR